LGPGNRARSVLVVGDWLVVFIGRLVGAESMTRKQTAQWLGGLLLAAIAAVWWQWPDGNLHLIACDVGQGDATLITKGFNQVLIDGGPPNNQVLTCLGKYMPFWDRKIEMLMVSHPQSDHLGGLLEVVRRYQVQILVVPNTGEATDLFRNFYQVVKARPIKVVTAKTGQQLILDGEVYGVIWPDLQPGVSKIWNMDQIRWETFMKAGATQDQLVNDQSTVLSLKYGQFKVLFTGDIEAKTEQALIDRGGLQVTTVLKVGHHGSKTSTSEVFLRALAPQLALIEVGKGNTYGHPNPEVVSRLQKEGIVVKRTDQLGDVEIISDGVEWRVR
jgi:competence protein ComEC